ncbi:MAG: hypothetical protein KH373_08645 [Ruminococcus sp.]|nr:hypothetical protein [Ruminococcus sp.]
MKKEFIINSLILNFILFVINSGLLWSGIAITQRTNFKLATYGYTLIILPFVMNFFLNYALYKEQPNKSDLKSSSFVIPMIILDILALVQYFFLRGLF